MVNIGSENFLIISPASLDDRDTRYRTWVLWHVATSKVLLIDI